MGSGTWTRGAHEIYTTSKGYASMDAFMGANANQLYKATEMDPQLNPYGVMRECRDSDEHPNTIPVILALDVTGSMGKAAEAIQKQLGNIMSSIYEKIEDVEFMIMGIGDLSYDRSPIQASQFESDIRIAEQLDKVFLEFGGGGNRWESYTAAWYFGVHHVELDCWKRNQKGIIITIGDEPLNPYLPANTLNRVLGCGLQRDVETPELYREALQKYNIFHIGVEESTTFKYYEKDILNTFGRLLKQNYIKSTVKDLGDTITSIISNADISIDISATKIQNGNISW